MSALDYWLFNSAISASLVLIVGAVASLLLRQPAHQQRLGELAFVLERSGNMIPTHYGEITYSQLKSMIHAGLSPRDPRVIRLSRWIAAHYTLSHNPAENGSLGVYYYYVTFAKTMHATGRAWIVGSTGVRHNWRRDLVSALARRIDVNGSWVNHGSKAWL